MINSKNRLLLSALTALLLVTLTLISSDGFAKTKFKKIIKDGKVTYLPVRSSEDDLASKANKPKESVTKRESIAKNKKNIIKGQVVLFEDHECQECRRIRRFFYKNKIAYVRKDIGLNKKHRFQLAQKTGGTQTPALYIGKQRINELSNKKLADLFNSLQKKSTKKTYKKPDIGTKKPQEDGPNY